MAGHRNDVLQGDKPSGVTGIAKKAVRSGFGAKRNVPDCVGAQCGKSEIVPVPSGQLAPSCAAARDDATINSFIVARVAPTNSLRAARASSVSKSTSVRITHGADWPLKR